LRDPKAWTLEGSNDKTNWTVLHSQSDVDDWMSLQTRNFSFNNTQTFTSCKFNISENNGDTTYTGCLGLEYYGWEDYDSPPVVAARSASQMSSSPDRAVLTGALTAGRNAEIAVCWGSDPSDLSESINVGWIGEETFSINVGTAASKGNRIIAAGGKITALRAIVVAAGNGIGAELGDSEPVPIEALQSATFEAGAFVYPALAADSSVGVGGVIFTAPSIIDNGLAFDPNAAPAIWRSIKPRRKSGPPIRLPPPSL
jgi:hypothetical protein